MADLLKFNDWRRTRRVNEEGLSPLQKEFREFFKDLLKEYDVESPADLTDAQKVEFFNKIDKDWVNGEGPKE